MTVLKMLVPLLPHVKPRGHANYALTIDWIRLFQTASFCFFIIEAVPFAHDKERAS
jgi:hypothetical protein